MMDLGEAFEIMQLNRSLLRRLVGRRGLNILSLIRGIDMQPSTEYTPDRNYTHIGHHGCVLQYQRVNKICD
jgi:hypothetical protein